MPIDLKQIANRPTPKAFVPYLTNASVPLLALIRDTSKKWKDGWCTYSDGFDENPDIEIMCGGENEKTPKAAAIWRQGNLLHFGFEQSPTEMNEAGQRLLLNSIAYISRFIEDRPIAVTPSVFGGPVAYPRAYLDRRLGEKGDTSEVGHLLSAAPLEQLKNKSADEIKAWHRENRGWLHPGSDVKLEIDADAKFLNVAIDKPEFFERTIAALPKTESLLARYAPEETKALDSPGAWQKWYHENKAYLFFSDQGDYRWYVDPLAKKRGIPSAKLRGPARATK